MESAGVEAGEKMFGIAGSELPAANATVATPTKRMATQPRTKQIRKCRPTLYLRLSYEGFDLSTRAQFESNPQTPPACNINRTLTLGAILPRHAGLFLPSLNVHARHQ